MKTVIKILFLLFIPFTIQYCSKAVEYKSTNSTTGNGNGTSSNGPGTNNPAATPYSPGQAGVYFPVDTTDTSKTHPAALYISLSRTSPCSAAGEVLNFTAVGYNIPVGATYMWDMGDGTPMNTSTVTGYKYIYAKLYTISVKATYNAKVVASKDTTIYAYGTSVKPTAVFYITQPQSTNPNYVACVNQTMSVATFKVFWSLGDGTLDSINYNPTHTFPTSSTDMTYRILLTAKADSSKCTDTVSHAITIPGISTSPSCNINYNQTDSCGPGKETFNFGGIVTGAPAGATYNWDYGDGTTDIGSSVTKQYVNPSNYVVRLTVSNSTLACSKTVKAFGVNNFPVANYNYTVNATGDTYSFQDSTILKSGNLTAYYWDFKDGITAHVASPSHTYTKDVVARTYNVLYGVKAANNCTSNITKTIFVPSK